MMTYYVKLRDTYAKEGTEPVLLQFDTLDDVMNFISLVMYGQPKYRHLEVTVTAEKKKLEEEE